MGKRAAQGKPEAPPALRADKALAPDLPDLTSLKEAFDLYTRTSRSMEKAYRKLEERLQTLDQELQARNQELALATDYLNSVLHSMSDGVVTVDTLGVITTFNRAAGEVLGYAEEEVVGQPFREVFGRDFLIPRGRILSELRTKGSEAVPVAERDSPIADRSNKRIGLVKVFQDLSEIEALRGQVRHKDRLAALGEMAATVAHEIRNPLGGIRGFANLLSRDIPKEDSRSRLVGKIIEGTMSLDAVVSELLEYTRPMDLTLAPKTCAEIITNALGYLEGHTGVEIENRVSTETKVMVDLEKMRQVFLNVLLNAAQSMPDGGKIVIDVEDNRDTMSFTITDMGGGIPAENFDRVFFPFYTTKEKGTGLGLAVASKIVECHGGSIEVTSEVGTGSTFRVSLGKENEEAP